MPGLAQLGEIQAAIFRCTFFDVSAASFLAALAGEMLLGMVLMMRLFDRARIRDAMLERCFSNRVILGLQRIRMSCQRRLVALISCLLRFQKRVRLVSVQLKRAKLCHLTLVGQLIDNGLLAVLGLRGGLD